MPRIQSGRVSAIAHPQASFPKAAFEGAGGKPQLEESTLVRSRQPFLTTEWVNTTTFPPRLPLFDLET